MQETRYILIYGGVVTGLSFLGPFDTQEEAVQYADAVKLRGYEIAELDDPNTTEDEEPETKHV